MEALPNPNTPEAPSFDENDTLQENAEEIIETEAIDVIQQLETLQFSDRRQVVEFFDSLADMNGQYDTKTLLNGLAAKGVSSHEFPVADEYDYMNGEAFANQLIGNALHELENHGHIANPFDYHSEVQEWKNNFANIDTAPEAETLEAHESATNKAA